MSKEVKDVRVNFMLAPEKHKDLLTLARISGKSVTKILTDYISRIISENQEAISQRRELDAKISEGVKF